jgi:hypothetical protein
LSVSLPPPPLSSLFRCPSFHWVRQTEKGRDRPWPTAIGRTHNGPWPITGRRPTPYPPFAPSGRYLGAPPGPNAPAIQIRHPFEVCEHRRGNQGLWTFSALACSWRVSKQGHTRSTRKSPSKSRPPPPARTDTHTKRTPTTHTHTHTHLTDLRDLSWNILSHRGDDMDG